jgi:hypothetical protein
MDLQMRATIWPLQMATALLLPLAAGMAGPVNAQGQGELKNWFSDPFIQVTKAIPDCPVPLGPLLYESEIKQEEHGRAERGTSCWLAGRCAKPNAYMYDADIAKNVQMQLSGSEAFKTSSLWITVKRRFVWVDGCVGDQEQEPALRRLLQGMPEMDQLFLNLSLQGAGGKPPYVVKP